MLGSPQPLDRCRSRPGSGALRTTAGGTISAALLQLLLCRQSARAVVLSSDRGQRWWTTTNSTRRPCWTSCRALSRSGQKGTALAGRAVYGCCCARHSFADSCVRVRARQSSTTPRYGEYTTTAMLFADCRLPAFERTLSAKEACACAHRFTVNDSVPMMDPASSSTVLEGFLQRHGAVDPNDASLQPVAPAVPPPSAKRQRLNDPAAAAAGADATVSAGGQVRATATTDGGSGYFDNDVDDDDDDDLIVVGVSTAADRAKAARQDAIDLIADTPQRQPAAAAVASDDSCVPVITERVLAEKIQQLASSKNFVDMSINDIRSKLSRMLGQDLTAHRQVIKRMVKTYAGIM